MAISRESSTCKECALVFPGMCAICYGIQTSNYDIYRSRQSRQKNTMPLPSDNSCGIKNCPTCTSSEDKRYSSIISAAEERWEAKHNAIQAIQDAQEKYAAYSSSSYSSGYSSPLNFTNGTTNSVTVYKDSPPLSAMNTQASTWEAAMKLELRNTRDKVKDLLKAIVELEEFARDQALIAGGKAVEVSPTRIMKKRDHFNAIADHMDDIVEHCKAAIEENT